MKKILKRLGLDLWADTGKKMKHRVSFETFIIVRRTIIGNKYVVIGHNGKALLLIRKYYKRCFYHYELAELSSPEVRHAHCPS